MKLSTVTFFALVILALAQVAEAGWFSKSQNGNTNAAANGERQTFKTKVRNAYDNLKGFFKGNQKSKTNKFATNEKPVQNEQRVPDVSIDGPRAKSNAGFESKPNGASNIQGHGNTASENNQHLSQLKNLQDEQKRESQKHGNIPQNNEVRKSNSHGLIAGLAGFTGGVAVGTLINQQTDTDINPAPAAFA